MRQVNLPTLIVVVLVLGAVGVLHVLHQPVPALLTSLVGVVTTSLLPQLMKPKGSCQAPTSPSSPAKTPTS